MWLFFGGGLEFSSFFFFFSWMRSLFYGYLNFNILFFCDWVEFILIRIIVIFIIFPKQFVCFVEQKKYCILLLQNSVNYIYMESFYMIQSIFYLLTKFREKISRCKYIHIFVLAFCRHIMLFSKCKLKRFLL